MRRNNWHQVWLITLAEILLVFAIKLLSLTGQVQGLHKYHLGQPRWPRQLTDELKKSPIRLRVRSREFITMNNYQLEFYTTFF